MFSPILGLISIVQDITYLETCLPFGAAVGPIIFSTISKEIFDLINDLLSDLRWDPSTLHVPEWETFDPPHGNDNTIPFATAIPLAIPVQYQPCFCEKYSSNARCAKPIQDVASFVYQNIKPTLMSGKGLGLQGTLAWRSCGDTKQRPPPYLLSTASLV